MYQKILGVRTPDNCKALGRLVKNTKNRKIAKN
jgi:predicted NAD-dependent protein-ADP-ribosyltransferase YbiA (DUF1768 family)